MQSDRFARKIVGILMLSDAEFRSAVQKVLNNIASYGDELASLMTERFQLFTAP